MARVGAILVAAGASTRAGGGTAKQFQVLGVEPMFVHALKCLVPVADEIVVVAPADAVETARGLVLESGVCGTVPVGVVAGGARRQDSVARGLAALRGDMEVVLVHDAARPFASAELARRVVEAVVVGGERGAVVPVVSVPDTVKRVDAGAVVATLDRSVLGLVQTPQGFTRATLADALAALGDAVVTDDAQAVELAGGRVAVVEGEPGNVKVTTGADLETARLRLGAAVGLDASVRVGIGYDLHRLVPGRRLVLCGVEVPFEKGLEGHSDADVATHAVMDALLGAVAAGDIGQHFPPGDPAYRGISSLVLLERVVEIVRTRGFAVRFVDVVIVAEKPRLAPFIPQMRQKLARVLGVPLGAVSVKATTTEGMGPEGTGEAMSARAVGGVRAAR
ncbi:MAG: 2-C-methyl-D-erythritol 2,4-cyclodiphosphate synthase [Candidatus Eisenbacteria bacterium]|nr:2-C-methyl-D-erythritol 2,4-cyclodiphosphate synthase [Candidatus Eisenbacteria bacterium]